MKFEMFSEVKLRVDIPEYNLPQGISAIIVDYCPRPEGQEDGYVLEVLDENGNGFEVIAVSVAQIEPIAVLFLCKRAARLQRTPQTV